MGCNRDEVCCRPQACLLDHSCNVVDAVALWHNQVASVHVATQNAFPHLHGVGGNVELILSRLQVSLAHRIMQEEERSGAANNPLSFEGCGDMTGTPAWV